MCAALSLRLKLEQTRRDESEVTKGFVIDWNKFDSGVFLIVIQHVLHAQAPGRNSIIAEIYQFCAM